MTGGGDAIVSSESEGVEGVEVRQFGPHTDDMLVIFMEGFCDQGDDDKTTEVCISTCLWGSGNIELMGGRSSDVRGLGRAEVCLRENEDVG